MGSSYFEFLSTLRETKFEQSRDRRAQLMGFYIYIYISLVVDKTIPVPTGSLLVLGFFFTFSSHTEYVKAGSIVFSLFLSILMNTKHKTIVGESTLTFRSLSYEHDSFYERCTRAREMLFPKVFSKGELD